MIPDRARKAALTKIMCSSSSENRNCRAVSIWSRVSSTREPQGETGRLSTLRRRLTSSSGTGSSTVSTPPRLTTSPKFTRDPAGSAGVPFTVVPLFEPRSYTVQTSSSPRMRAACCRETTG